MKSIQDYIDGLVGLGGYSPDVIATDEEWITISRQRLVELLRQVINDAQAGGDTQLSYEELTRQMEARNLAR